MHPQGLFPAMVVDHGITKSKNGTPQIVIKFETDLGILPCWLPMTERSAEYTIEKLRNIGYHSDTLADLAGGQCMVGRLCVIVVEHEQYQGKTNARVRQVWPKGYEGADLQSESSDSEAVKNITRFDALLRKMQKSDGKGASVPDAPGDDIPF